MHQHLIPERDSGPAPHPKPRTKPGSPKVLQRKRVSKLSEKDVDEVLSLSSVSSASSNGITNLAYTHDENDLEMNENIPPAKISPRPRPKQRVNKYFSSDSENDHNNKPTGQSLVFQADIHNFPTRQMEAKLDSDNHDSWKLENETKPRPKPRRKAEASPSDTEVSTDSNMSLSTSNKKNKGTSSDYVTIPMPAEKDNNEPERDWDAAPAPQLGSQSFVKKWKKAAQTFIEKQPSIKLGKGKNKNNNNNKPETRIEIESLDNKEGEESQEAIEMQEYPQKLTTESQEENPKRASRTKAMLKVQDDAEIERMKNIFESPSGSKPDLPAPDVLSPSKRERRRAEKQEASEKCFGVTVHSCDLLPMDPNVVHPVIKVMLLNEDGSCLTKNSTVSQETPTTRSSSKTSSRRKKHDAADADEEIQESKSKRGKAKSKTNISSNNKSSSGPTQKFTADSVLPIMTQPCKLSYYLPTFAPNWNELILFDEPFSSIVHPNSTAMLFFEVMDFLPIKGPHSSTKIFGNYRGNEDGWYKIAWGFLRLIGTNGSRNVNRRLRLQLYRPEQLSSKHNVGEIEVYHWWKLNRRHKLDATLYVTVKGVVSKTKTAASFRQLLGMRKGDLAQAILESQIHSPKSSKQQESTEEQLKRQPGQADITVPRWTRLDGQICKIPNKLLKSLPSSPIESLNLTISGNVQCVQFSPCGMKLAATLDTDELHTILIFEIPSGKLLSNIRCHHGIVYDLDWKIIEMKNLVVPSLYYLASASADSTATVWTVKNGTTETPKLLKLYLGWTYPRVSLEGPVLSSIETCSNSTGETGQHRRVGGNLIELKTGPSKLTRLWDSSSPGRAIEKLLHPSFVYCVKIHPTKSNLVFTGCFDYAIRIWNIQRTTSSSTHGHDLDTESIPIILLDRHESFVNCIKFNQLGTHLYSGDGTGCLFEWTTQAPTKKKSWKAHRELTFIESGKHPINAIDLHPHENRLLVHVRNSSIKVVDLATFLVLHTLSGVVNEKLQIRSCFSPCGNLVFSGSEDATVCVWDADTGAILQFLSPENHRHCVVTCADYHPHDYYFVIGLASSISEPSPIMLYTHKQGKSAKVKLQTLGKLATLSKQSTQSSSAEQETLIPDAVDPSAFGISRGDSTEKFVRIVKKLDAALKATRRTTTTTNPSDTSQTIAPLLALDKGSRSSRTQTPELPEYLLSANNNNNNPMSLKKVEESPGKNAIPSRSYQVQDDSSPLKIHSTPANYNDSNNNNKQKGNGQLNGISNGGPRKTRESDPWALSSPKPSKGIEPSREEQLQQVFQESQQGSESNAQISRVRQKRRQKMRLMYESSDY